MFLIIIIALRHTLQFQSRVRVHFQITLESRLEARVEFNDLRTSIYLACTTYLLRSIYYDHEARRI